MTITDGRTLPWRVVGRAVRPYALILSVVTFVFGVNAILGRTTHLSGVWEDICGIIAVLSAGFLWAGWWARSLRAMAAGLVTACWTWAFVAVHLIATTGDVWSLSAWISGCWSALAGLLWLRDRRGSV